MVAPLPEKGTPRTGHTFSEKQCIDLVAYSLVEGAFEVSRRKCHVAATETQSSETRSELEIDVCVQLEVLRLRIERKRDWCRSE